MEGTESTPSRHRPLLGTRLTEALSRGEPEAEQEVRLEAGELARALAAQAIALASDAEAGEYRDRLQTLSRIVCPPDPLEGYSLESSLGAFFVARLAMSWAPPSDTAIRATPLERDALLLGLREAGVEARQALAVVADFTGVEPDFVPDPNGLRAATLAGLAEKSLTRPERLRALSQVAYSPRCLARLSAACQSLKAVRQVLPVLPPEETGLSSAYVTGIAALVLGRPDRCLQLIAGQGDAPELKALEELATVELALLSGEPPGLEDDPSVPIVPLEAPRKKSVRPPPPPPRDTLEPDGLGMAGLASEPRATVMERRPSTAHIEEDDVLEIVEEQVSLRSEVAATEPPPAPSQTKPSSAPPRSVPRPPGWARRGWDPVALDDGFLRLWRHTRAGRRSLFGELQALLGLNGPPMPRWVPAVAIPPEATALKTMLEKANVPTEQDLTQAATEVVDASTRLREEAEKLGLSSPNALIPSVRAALRGIVAAAEGHAPTGEAILAAGDLEWVVIRARAVALVIQGEPSSAMAILEPFGGPAAPEGLWAQTQLFRFEGRRPQQVRAPDARRAAAALVADLAQQLGRTVAGTLV